MNSLRDQDLPLFFHAADQASALGQRRFLAGTRLRLAGAVLAALGGTFSFTLSNDVWSLVALTGFVVAFVAELFLLVLVPEKSWYQARAGAESAKTLSWRFAVAADPFFSHLPPQDAEHLFRLRIGQVARQVAQSVTMPSGDAAAPTANMKLLRNTSFDTRKTVYLRDRNEAQQIWYSDKANTNKSIAYLWRVFLLGAEVIAIVLASGRLFAGWEVDLAGLLAAFIGAGAAWLATKQYSTLQAAYSLTAAELAKQRGALLSSTESDWALSASDAEEAISREHTTWLASRGGVNEALGVDMA